MQLFVSSHTTFTRVFYFVLKSPDSTIHIPTQFLFFHSEWIYAVAKNTPRRFTGNASVWRYILLFWICEQKKKKTVKIKYPRHSRPPLMDVDETTFATRRSDSRFVWREIILSHQQYVTIERWNLWKNYFVINVCVPLFSSSNFTRRIFSKHKHLFFFIHNKLVFFFQVFWNSKDDLCKSLFGIFIATVLIN